MAMRQTAVPVLSVIVPMFNESANIDALFGRLVPVVEGLRVPYEIVCVDDGSGTTRWRGWWRCASAIRRSGSCRCRAISARRSR